MMMKERVVMEKYSLKKIREDFFFLHLLLIRFKDASYGDCSCFFLSLKSSPRLFSFFLSSPMNNKEDAPTALLSH